VEVLLQGRFAPDAEFHPLYLDRVYGVVEGVRQMWVDMNEAWEDHRSQVGDIVDLGGHVLLLTRITACGPRGGVPVDYRIAMLGRFQGDMLVWGKPFSSKREALEAVTPVETDTPSDGIACRVKPPARKAAPAVP
jgi:hypothetical protein